MESLVTWIGGKVKYIDAILPLIPRECTGYVDPFVGGGSVYLAVQGFERYRVNDLCPELMALYRVASRGKREFLFHLENIAAAWFNADRIFERYKDEFVRHFTKHSAPDYSYHDFIDGLNKILRKIPYGDIFPTRYTSDDDFELEKRFRFCQAKMKMDKAPQDDDMLPVLLLTAMKLSVYSYLTELYNSKTTNADLKNATLLSILTLSTNGQYTFDRKGDFRPAYGGRTRNSLPLGSKVRLIKSKEFRARMKQTTLSCDDALIFLDSVNPGREDFIYLDPPLGNMLKKVGNHTYSADEFQRLREWLQECQSPWLMTIPKASLPSLGYLGDGKVIHPLGPHGEILAVMNYNPYPQ